MFRCEAAFFWEKLELVINVCLHWFAFRLVVAFKRCFWVDLSSSTVFAPFVFCDNFWCFFPDVDAESYTVVHSVQCFGASRLICGILAGVYPFCRCCSNLLKRQRVGNQFSVYRFIFIRGYGVFRSGHSGLCLNFEFTFHESFFVVLFVKFERIYKFICTYQIGRFLCLRECHPSFVFWFCHLFL